MGLFYDISLDAQTENMSLDDTEEKEWQLLQPDVKFRHDNYSGLWATKSEPNIELTLVEKEKNEEKLESKPHYIPQHSLGTRV